MGEIRDDVRIAEEAIARILEKIKEIPPLERNESGRYFVERVRKLRLDLKNLDRGAVVFDILYSDKRRRRKLP